VLRRPRTTGLAPFQFRRRGAYHALRALHPNGSLRCTGGKSPHPQAPTATVAPLIRLPARSRGCNRGANAGETSTPNMSGALPLRVPFNLRAGRKVHCGTVRLSPGGRFRFLAGCPKVRLLAAMAGSMLGGAIAGRPRTGDGPMTRAVSLITTLLGGALASVASVVAEAQLVPPPTPRTAAAWAACQKEADAAVPAMGSAVLA
jgi:hypothetical protein